MEESRRMTSLPQYGQRFSGNQHPSILRLCSFSNSIQYTGSISTNVQEYPSRLQTRSVVPEPANGSNTVPSSGVVILRQRSTKPSFNCVGHHLRRCFEFPTTRGKWKTSPGTLPRGSARLSPLAKRHDGTLMLSGNSGASCHRKRTSGLKLFPRSF